MDMKDLMNTSYTETPLNKTGENVWCQLMTVAIKCEMLQKRNTIPVSAHVVSLLISILAIIMNVVEIGLLLHKRKQTRTEVVLISLSMADIMVATCLTVTKLNHLGVIPSSGFIYILILTFFMILTSILHVVVITVERVVAVMYPFWHKAYVTRRKIVIALCIIWLQLVLGYSTEMVLIKVYRVPLNKLMLGTMKFISALFFTMALFVITAYTLIVLRFKCSLNSKQSQDQAMRRSKERRLVITSCSISGVYIVCHLPYTVAIWYSFVWVFKLQICISLSALMNSLVYFFLFKCMETASMESRDNSRAETKQESTSGYSRVELHVI